MNQTTVSEPLVRLAYHYTSDLIDDDMITETAHRASKCDNRAFFFVSHSATLAKPGVIVESPSTHELVHT